MASCRSRRVLVGAGRDTAGASNPCPIEQLVVADGTTGTPVPILYEVFTGWGEHPHGWLIVRNLSMTDQEAEELLRSGAVEPGTRPRCGCCSYPARILMVGSADPYGARGPEPPRHVRTRLQGRRRRGRPAVPRGHRGEMADVEALWRCPGDAARTGVVVETSASVFRWAGSPVAVLAPRGSNRGDSTVHEVGGGRGHAHPWVRTSPPARLLFVSVAEDDVVAQVERLRELFAHDLTDPPAGWDVVRAYEAEHTVTLPEPFRTFTATVTSGGTDCGPGGYGLATLSVDPPGALNAPFPLTEARNWYADPPTEDESDLPWDGILPLSTDSGHWFLVVTGSHRGHVWEVNHEVAQPFGREFGYTTGSSGFLGWIEHWHPQTKEFGCVDWWDVATSIGRIMNHRAGADGAGGAPSPPGELGLTRTVAAADAINRTWRSIARGEAALAEVLSRAADERDIGRIPLGHLVWALPDFRRGDAKAVIRSVGLHPASRAMSLTPTTRRALLDAIRSWHPGPGGAGPA